MASDVAYLVSKGYVPIVNHDDRVYKAFEEEVARASTGILGKPTLSYALRSESSNVYAIRLPSGFVIGVTDTLLQDTSFDFLDLIGQPIIAEFFSRECGYYYDPAAPAPTRADLVRDLDAKTLASFNNPKVRLFHGITDFHIKFMAFHEVAHIKCGHLANLGVGAALAEVPEAYGRPEQSYLDREREADCTAATWLAQVMIRQYPRIDPKVTTRPWWFQLAMSFLGAAIPIRRISPPVIQGAMTYPLLQERTFNIAAWFGMVVNSDLREIDADQQFDFLVRLILVVEDAARGLKWEPLTWAKEHMRPWLP